jgi:4-amino-4-deoxy-L-arabinose transferase-like glycosyltransferase
MTASNAASRRLLLLVLVVAGAVRLWGLGFGLPTATARPDETALAGPAVMMLSGQFHPPNFIYPTGFMGALAVLYVAYYWISQPFAHYATLAIFAESRRQSLAPFLYISRGLSAVMGTLTVWSVFAIARRLFDDTIGLVAALFLALSFLHVRDSHFGVTDVAMTSLIVLAVLLIVGWQQHGDLWRAAMAGLVGGLAMATKYNGLGVCVPFAVAVVQQFFESRRSFGDTLRHLSPAVLAFVSLFVLAFIAAFPYAIIEWRQVVADASSVVTTLEHGRGIELPRGWWYHARVTLPVAFGWPVYLAGLAGTAGLLTRRLRQSAVLLSFPCAYYIVAGSGHSVFARYMIPVLPFLAIAAAWCVVTIARLVTSNLRASTQGWAIATAVVLAIAPAAGRVVLIDRLLARTDNRVVVGRALFDLIPQGSIVYQSGESYGLAATDIDGRSLNIHLRGYVNGHFAPEGGPLPDWIILQRSPLALYSDVPAGVEQLVRERYDLAAAFTPAPPRTDRVYDPQDAFFLPLKGLTGIERPGPNFEVYRLRPTPPG